MPYHYTRASQMTPLLPSDAKLNTLRPLAAQLIARAKDLPAQGLPMVRHLLRENLRPMNSYYSNKIEGQHTEPLLIEAALQQDFSAKPDEAKKQRIALAHIKTERWSESLFDHFEAAAIFSSAFVQSIHEHLHAQLPADDLLQHSEESEENAEKSEIIVPGQFRQRGVKVGAHIPPNPANIAEFMDFWQNGYQEQLAGESALIALFAAHHRLAWIHPFIDGNGRVSRLHTHIGLTLLGLTQGLWSPLRGLARAQSDYYAHLIAADSDRKGDYDGRGNLSEQDLMSFISFMINICLDQISFMDSLLNLDEWSARLSQMLAAEGTKEATKSLKIEAAIPLTYLGTIKSIERSRFKAMMGLADRTADRVLADLLKLGILTSQSPKGALELALPLHLFRYLFPQLWPEAEASIR